MLHIKYDCYLDRYLMFGVLALSKWLVKRSSCTGKSSQRYSIHFICFWSYSYGGSCQGQHPFSLPKQQQRNIANSIPSYKQPWLNENSQQERLYESGHHQQLYENNCPVQSSHQPLPYENNCPVQSHDTSHQLLSYQPKHVYRGQPQFSEINSHRLCSLSKGYYATPKRSTTMGSDQYSGSPAALGSACAQAQEPTKVYNPTFR